MSRARIERPPGGSTTPIDPNGHLGRWRYLRHDEELDDYLFTIRPTHSIAQGNGAIVSPLPTTAPFRLEDVPQIRSAIEENKSASLLVTETSDAALEERLQEWDAGTAWDLHIVRVGTKDEGLYEARLTAVSSDAHPIGPIALTEPAGLVNFVRAIAPTELLVPRPRGHMDFLLTGTEEVLRAVVSQIRSLVRDRGEAHLNVRRTTRRALSYRAGA